MAQPTRGPWRDRGYLLHFDRPGELQHMVFGLADSIPRGAFERLRAVAPEARVAAAEGWLDRGVGSRLLGRPEIADMVADALKHFDGNRYHLAAWAVMPTHVHVLAASARGTSLSSIVHSWKSYTAHQANRLLGRRGAFWSEEYFDRAMRNDRQTEATAQYVESNPVAAGLCQRPGDWPWSSASRR